MGRANRANRHYLIAETEGQKVLVGCLEDERFFELTRGIRVPRGFHFVHTGTTHLPTVMAFPRVEDTDAAGAVLGSARKAENIPTVLKVQEVDGPRYYLDRSGKGLCRICNRAPVEVLAKGRRFYGWGEKAVPYRGFCCEQCAENLEDVEYLPWR